MLKSSIPYEVGSTSFKVDSGPRKSQVHCEQGVVVVRSQVFLLVRAVPVGCQLGYKTNNNLNCKLKIHRSWHNGWERNFKTRSHAFNSWQKFSFPLSVLETDPWHTFNFLLGHSKEEKGCPAWKKHPHKLRKMRDQKVIDWNLKFCCSLIKVQYMFDSVS